METGEGRVVRAKLPPDLAERLNQIGTRIERTKSWIIRQAVAEWLAEEKRRHELTLESMRDFDEGRFVHHEEILGTVASKKAQASKTD